MGSWCFRLAHSAPSGLYYRGQGETRSYGNPAHSNARQTRLDPSPRMVGPGGGWRKFAVVYREVKRRFQPNLLRFTDTRKLTIANLDLGLTDINAGFRHAFPDAPPPARIAVFALAFKAMKRSRCCYIWRVRWDEPLVLCVTCLVAVFAAEGSGRPRRPMRHVRPAAVAIATSADK